LRGHEALVAVLAVTALSRSHAAAFADVAYSPTDDELIVTLIYRGTNPDHEFSLHWGECHHRSSARGGQEIAAELLDSQWKDRAEREYRKTVRFDLSGMPCRPAEVTLRTAPGFHSTLFIPEMAPNRSKVSH
jgi:hypothetical protein